MMLALLEAEIINGSSSDVHSSAKQAWVGKPHEADRDRHGVPLPLCRSLTTSEKDQVKVQ